MGLYGVKALRLGHEQRQRVPRFFRPDDLNVPDVQQRVHWDAEWARRAGSPAVYDYGRMRETWLIHLCTDWMGDDAWLWKLDCQFRRFNYVGDTHWVRGRIDSSLRDRVGPARHRPRPLGREPAGRDDHARPRLDPAAEPGARAGPAAPPRPAAPAPPRRCSTPSSSGSPPRGPMSAPGTWVRDEQHTILELLRTRVEESPDDPYLDVTGVALTAGEVSRSAARIGGALRAVGVQPGDRVASLIENSAEAVLLWFGILWAGGRGRPGEHRLQRRVPPPPADRLRARGRWSCRTTWPSGPSGSSPRCRPSSTSSSSTARRGAVASARPPPTPGPTCSTAREGAPASAAPADLATFVYTGGTTGPSKGCMLSHNYHQALARQIGICWQRTADDVVWTPLPLFHFNAIVTAVVGPLLFGGSGAISGSFSVSNFWPEMNRTGATITSTLGTMAYLLAHDEDRPEMPRSGRARGQRLLRLLGAAPMPVEVDRIIRERFGIDTFSGAYGLTEASLVSWQPPGVENKPTPPGWSTTSTSTSGSSTTTTTSCPGARTARSCCGPSARSPCSRATGAGPEATVEASRNWWFHTGDIGRIDEDDFLFFVDRKADYLRRRGENISSFEVERILMGHGGAGRRRRPRRAQRAGRGRPQDHAPPCEPTPPSPRRSSSAGAMDELPYFVLPRYIEFRAELPRNPVGRVLKRTLRDEGVTAATWSVDDAGIEIEKR